MNKSESILRGVKRINVVGTTGSGKSTFSRTLSEILEIPYLEIDTVYWRPNWHEPTDEEFFSKLKAALYRDKWVLDGNYGRTVPIKWKEVQAVIWLDYPFPVVFYRAVKRAITRAINKKELWQGTRNRESFRRSFFSRDSILLWTLKTFRDNRVRYSSAMQDPQFAYIQFIRLTSPGDAQRFLNVILNGLS